MIKLNNKDTGNLYGRELIKHYMKLLPNKPGVYRMIDEHNKVLYVGKAKDLKKRVSNYTRVTASSSRIMKMISQTKSMEFIITQTENEALLLEANLIKNLKPIYNILLRDDKSFPYIIITKDHPIPALYKYRGAKTRPGYYFGPFANIGAVNRTIKALQRGFLIRNCSDSFFANRTRPCLLYQIKRCSGPCTGEISTEDYAKLVLQARDFLTGKAAKIRKELINLMNYYAQKQEYEFAAIYRDRLSALAHIQSEQNINNENLNEVDIFALSENGNLACIEVFFYRMGQNWGNYSYFIKITEDQKDNKADILEQFISQFYDNKPIAKLILTSHPISNQEWLQQALSEKSKRKIEITTPKKGEKLKILQQAINNASEALARKSAQESNYKKLLEQLYREFKLKIIPNRIEIYDNSHIMGNHAIGAMVVFGKNGFDKTQYRKFNIDANELTPGDDFAMMKQVLSRRFSRLLKDIEEQQNCATEDFIPNLIIIDGGKGQLSSVLSILNELSSKSYNILDNIDIIAIAKGIDRNAGNETFHTQYHKDFKLDKKSELLYFIQNLRDEAHRFAISSHRILRKKNMMKNPLSQIDSIGNKRKQALLNHFGSAKAVSQATIKDLIKVEGISLNIAKIIYDFFHE